MNIQKTYQEYAKAYDRLSQKAKLYQELKNAHVECILQNTEKEDKILDFGAGTGNATLEFLISGRNVDAVDVSPDMIEILKEKCENTKGLKIIDKDILNIPKKNLDIYTSVNMMNVLYHLKNPDEYLLKFNKLLTPGGIIAVSGPHQNINTKNLFDEIKKNLIEKNLWEEFKTDFETCLNVNKNKLVPNAKLYKQKELEELFEYHGFNKISYSGNFYNGHNYFAVFKKNK